MKINWNDPDLQKAYKPVPEAFRQTVSRTARSVREEGAAPRRGTAGLRRRMLVPILIGILLIAMAVAYAVARPVIMDWISEAKPVQELVQSLAAENSADGITARIDSVVFDGERFLFGYELENADPALPAMVVVDGVRVNGRTEGLEAVDASSADPRIVPSPRQDILPVTRNPVSGTGWSLPMEQELTGEVTCEVTFLVYRPVKSFVYVRDGESGIDALDEYDEEQQKEVLDAWETLKSFRNTVIAGPGDPDEESWFADGYTVIDSEGMIAWNDDNAGLYNMRETARIPVTVTFDAGAPKVWDYSGTADIGRGDCTVHFEKARFSPLTTQLTFLLIPKEDTREAAQALRDRYGSWWLADGRGERIEPVLYEKMSHSEPDLWVVQDWPGTKGWAVVCQACFAGLEPRPDSVGLATEQGELVRFTLK